MKKQYSMMVFIFLMIFSFSGAINGVAFELDPGPGGPTHTSHTVSTTHTFKLKFVDAFTQMIDSETVTVTLTVKYDYYLNSRAYYYTYYSFRVTITDTDTWLSRTTYDTYVLQIGGQDIVYTSKSCLGYPYGWSSSGSISGASSYNKLNIWFGVYTNPSISGDVYDCVYKTINKGTSNSAWTYYYGSTYLGNFGNASPFLIYEYL